MAHRYDVSLKALFLREGDGIMRRLLFGGKVTEHLATEQPQVFNHRADMVVRTEDGSLHREKLSRQGNVRLLKARYVLARPSNPEYSGDGNGRKDDPTLAVL